jgi:hypothetical protein
MWRVVETDDYARQSKWYSRKKRREFAAVVTNLGEFLQYLQHGNLPRPFAYGFLHDEPAGVIAIDQRGAPTKLAATRLYIYAYVERETVYLLTIGDKRTQSDDILFCKHLVDTINANPNFGIHNEDEPDEDEAGADEDP